MQRYLGYIFILAAATLWSLVGIFCIYCLRGGMAPQDITFWRTFIAGTLFCLHAGITGTLHVHSKRDFITLCLFGIICLGVMFSLSQGAMQEGGAALASILLYTAPIWVAVASRLIFKETLTRIKILCIALSLAGVACISLSSGGGTLTITPLAVALGLGSGFLYAGNYIFAKRFLERYSAFTLYGCSMLAASAACFPFAHFDAAVLASVWFPLLLVALICTYGSYWAYSEGIKRIEPTKAVILATFEPMLAVFAAWWWLGESFSPLGWVGTALVLSAVFLIILDGAKRPARTTEEAEERQAEGAPEKP